MPVEVWREKSLQICNCLQASALFAEAKTILAYFSLRQEPDLSGLFSVSKTWGFPRCVEKSLDWHSWSFQESLPLQTGAFGILEPHPDAPRLSPEQVDLILVPAIACDRQGYRLGYGGGFYDRLLTKPEWATKPTVGIVFDFARLLELPHDSWDQPLQAVCSEAGFFLPPSSTDKV
ncbi:MAG: 5-formyltetrahydrofolate cyclo-ligase [Kovacikia sp.]